MSELLPPIYIVKGQSFFYFANLETFQQVLNSNNIIQLDFKHILLRIDFVAQSLFSRAIWKIKKEWSDVGGVISFWTNESVITSKEYYRYEYSDLSEYMYDINLIEKFY